MRYKPLEMGRYLLFSAVMAYGLLLLSNVKAPKAVEKNLTGMINRRPELVDYLWVADYSE